MFALTFVHGTLPKMFQPKEWELFTGVILDEPQAASSGIAWIDESRHAAVSKLQAHLPTLYNNLQLTDQGTWSEFSRAVDCENSVPSAIETRITPFQKLSSAISEHLPSINPPPFNLSDILAETTNQEPILLILAGGADPSQRHEKALGQQKRESRIWVESALSADFSFQKLLKLRLHSG
ncbi:unnamed protein product [Cylicostephanus goldi]|uniref:Dynein heavy chain region D6 P-loop domain-containing protein n=1 Tax=Cylicostephanus goldi TaxID=71465 RepID=A0A3P7MRS2_CYLGO|nr:unnamed protein product [Cylicostephanus goldi]